MQVEAVSAEISVTQPGEIRLYLRAFASLAEGAVYGAAARELIMAEVAALTMPDGAI